MPTKRHITFSLLVLLLLLMICLLLESRHRTRQLNKALRQIHTAIPLRSDGPLRNDCPAVQYIHQNHKLSS